MRAPLPPNETQRLEDLRRYFDDDVEQDESLQELARYVADVCAMPVSLVSVVQADRQRFAANVGFARDETSRDASFCAHTMLVRGIFEVPDALADERFRDNELVVGDPGVRFYAGVPVSTAEGSSIGALCVLDTVPRTLTRFQRRTLLLFAQQVEARLELKRKIREVEAANAVATAAAKAKSQFVANMSHELRTPLTTIFGYTELLRETALDQGQTDLVADIDTIRTAGHHLLAVINEVLDLSKSEAGKMMLHASEFAVTDLVGSVVATMTPTVERNANVFRVQVEEGVGTMRGDATKLRQCLYNLLANAAKFTREGEVTLRVWRRRPLPSDAARAVSWFLFEISDTGIGMTETQATTLFQSFVQAEASTSRTFGGTGLGLALTREFAHLMGGDVQARSARGVGSVFTLEIPDLEASE